MAAALVYFLFFFSGVSGLVYQVVWVREFGTVFGNTIYSSSIVVAIFMLGLGLGSYLAGSWADRRYATAPASLLRTYGFVELLIAGPALAGSISRRQRRSSACSSARPARSPARQLVCSAGLQACSTADLKVCTTYI